MPLLNDGAPLPLHAIPPRAYVQLGENTWRRLASWTVLDKVHATSDRFQVCWVGTEYPSTFLTEPSWPVWVGDEPPRTSGVVS